MIQAAAADPQPAPAPPKGPPGSRVSPSTVTPPLPGTKTPADTLRELLETPPTERSQALAGRSEDNRKYLETRLREFEAMSPSVREARLKQLDLEWHLLILMKMPPEGRAEHLATVPNDLRPLIEERLRQWDLLTASVQKEVLDYETTANYFLRGPNPRAHDSKSDQDNAELKSRAAADGVARFLALSAREQEKTLEALPSAERQEMEKTLQAFAKLPPEQRKACINSFEKLSRMTKEQRDQFLKNAERWRAMSSKERETWQTLVKILPSTSAPSSPPPFPTALSSEGGGSTGLTAPRAK